jgi:hypothetical protein
MRTRIAIAVALALAACGGSTSSGTGDSGSGSAQHDAPQAYNFGCAGGSACDMPMVCCFAPATSAFSCEASTSCAMADQIACDGPEDCSGSTPVCCGVDVPDGSGSYPKCTPTSLGATCTSAADCSTHLGTSCSDTTTVQLCQVMSDCHDPTDNECCTFTSGSASLTFCIDSGTASLGGATCH